MKRFPAFLICWGATLLLTAPRALAWDYEGHSVINQLALASLPQDFPAFVLAPAARGRVAFLAGEPDRWRNTPDLPLQHCQEPEHFLDIEELADCGLTPDTLPMLRYDFVAQVAAAHKAHPEKFPVTREDPARKYCWAGLLPWAITENYAKLKSEFSYLKTFQTYGGTPVEIANAQANILYTMGVMGHYVGDGSQPLHATKHHHGWEGENPRHYPTNHTFHGWIDGGYFKKIGGLKYEALVGRVRPAQHVGDPTQPDGFFRAMVAYVVADNKMVEPLYQLEQAHKLSPHEGDINPEGRAFMEGRILVGAQMLGNIWLSAWQDAPEDKYLKGELAKRAKAAESGDSQKNQ